MEHVYNFLKYIMNFSEIFLKNILTFIQTSNNLRLQNETSTIHNDQDLNVITNFRDIDDVRMHVFLYIDKGLEVCKNKKVFQLVVISSIMFLLIIKTFL